MSDLGINDVSGSAIAIHGNDIDTDRIIPARFLKSITFSELGERPFQDERFEPDGTPRDHPFNRPERRAAKFLFVNSNFGCGSSREHAPQCLRQWGIRALVGVSFGEIFAGNCEMLGVPAVRASAEDIAKLQAAADADAEVEFTLDLDAMKIRGGNLEIEVEMPENRRRSLREGHWDTTGTLVANADKTRAVYERLPYLNDYR